MQIITNYYRRGRAFFKEISFFAVFYWEVTSEGLVLNSGKI